MTAPSSDGWQRLDRRMIVIDAAQVLASFAAMAVVTWVSGGEGFGGGSWPVIIVAATGILSAATDAYRWATTRYRVTAEMVERRSGLFVTSHRTVRRDRVRTVDIHAKLRHRIGGLRLVKIGAGQQSTTGEAAFDLDAVSAADAQALRSMLLDRTLLAPSPSVTDATDATRQPPIDTPSPPSTGAGEELVLARFRPTWVIHNVFNVWAFVMAAGVIWGAWWLLPAVGLDPNSIVDRVADTVRLGPTGAIALGAAAVGVVGVVGLGINFMFEHGNFELSRVRHADGTAVLRTRQGLLTTREIAFDEHRIRGVQISEPLFWRWMGTADTTVVTTGLNMTSMSQPSALLPRGPITLARPVAAAVLDADSHPLDAPLRRHPRAALRRRLWWATFLSATTVALAGWLAATDVVPPWAVAATATSWPLTLVAALVAYRALGHTISGHHLVVRSGLANRATTALQRNAVSTIAIRESVFQRRLGLCSVTAMTAAGYGAYEAPDLCRADATTFASEAAPGILQPFLQTRRT